MTATAPTPAPDAVASEPLLWIEHLEVRYGSAVALRELDLGLPGGTALAILGANGAGKSTLARAIAGRVAATAGTIHFDGIEITSQPAHARSRAGIQLLPEGRGIFPGLTVSENLRLFTQTLERPARAEAIERVHAHFPILGERRQQTASSLSGGQQQMLAVARVIASRPRLLIADELSLGLAPIVVDQIFETLQTLRASGLTTIVIEQYIERATAFADQVLILSRGRAAWRGPAAEAEAAAHAHYIGGAKLPSAPALEENLPSEGEGGTQAT